jgi:protoheme ferro-lyase
MTTPAPRRIGVLLINLGTPDAATPRAVRRYLAEFLSDRRVIEIPQLVWQPILRGAILTTRPKRSAHAYAQVWSEEGSPLAAITARQAAALGRELVVAFQSRFGRAKWLDPATEARLAALPAEGVTRVAVVAPGFSADCLETLEELAIRGRETFLAAGGSDFAYLPCLNDSAAGIATLKTLLARELEGWR